MGNTTSDLKRAFNDFTNPLPKNRERAISNAAALILRDPSQRVERLYQICDLAQVRVMHKVAAYAKELKQGFEELIRQLIEGGWDEMILEIERHLNLGVDLFAPGSAVDPALCARIRRYRASAVVNGSTTLIKNAYYTYIGTSFTLSMDWALKLLGLIDDMWTRGAVTLAHTFVLQEVLAAFMAPPSDLLPVKRWFEQLLHHLEDREDARQIFRDLYAIVRTHSRMKEIRDPQESRRLSVLKRERLGTTPADLEEILRFANLSMDELFETYKQGDLCIASTDIPHIQAYSQIEASRLRARLATGQEAKTWLEQYGATARQTMNDQWKEICERPVRLPRPDRLDFVEINVPVLHQAGVRGVILNAEEGISDMVLEIYLRERTPHLHRYKCPISDIMTSDHIMPVVPLYLDQPTLAELLRIALVDICHRIIVRDEDFPPHPGGSCFGGTANVEIIRRAHRRALLPGQSPGREALERAARANFRLEPGYTFVKAVTKEDGTLTHGLPSRPFALYTQQDFLKRIA